jgi:hypothetical protein
LRQEDPEYGDNLGLITTLCEREKRKPFERSLLMGLVLLMLHSQGVVREGATELHKGRVYHCHSKFKHPLLAVSLTHREKIIRCLQ